MLTQFMRALTSKLLPNNLVYTNEFNTVADVTSNNGAVFPGTFMSLSKLAAGGAVGIDIVASDIPGLKDNTQYLVRLFLNTYSGDSELYVGSDAPYVTLTQAQLIAASAVGYVDVLVQVADANLSYFGIYLENGTVDSTVWIHKMEMYEGAAIGPNISLLTDVSLANADKSGITVDFDALYLAQHYPFVNLFMLMDTVNNVSSKFKVEYWNGDEWVAAVDLLDGSEGLKKSGMLQFSLKNDEGWCEVTETDDDSTSCPIELKGLCINDCYWLKISFVNSGIYQAPNTATKIKKIAYAFTTTEYVNSIDVEGPSYYDSILTGKTNWIDEIIHASEEMVHDLKRVGFIKSAGQIIEFDEVYLACAWKTLAHIYFNLGKAYNENRAIVNAKYEKALNSKALTFDNDGDGKLKRRELQATTTRMIR